MNENNNQKLINKAEVLAKSGKYDEAKPLWEKICKRKPDFYKAQYWKCIYDLFENKLDHAETLTKDLLPEGTPEDVVKRIHEDNFSLKEGYVELDPSVTVKEAPDQNMYKQDHPLFWACSCQRAITLHKKHQKNKKIIKNILDKNNITTDIVGEHYRTRQMFQRIDEAMSQRKHILVTGNTGCGKELVVEMFRIKEEKEHLPFVKLNCYGIPQGLEESTLLGYERGSFTGAERTTQGLFEQAGYGTLYMDEIGNLSLSAQGKILRVVENKDFRRVGGTIDLTNHARIIGATNKDLGKLISEDNFREDLYDRLNEFKIEVPPLFTTKPENDNNDPWSIPSMNHNNTGRESDIPLLIRYFFDEEEVKINPEICVKMAIEIIHNYNQMDSRYLYPNLRNIRDLKHHIERISAITKNGGYKEISYENECGKYYKNDFYYDGGSFLFEYDCMRVHRFNKDYSKKESARKISPEKVHQVFLENNNNTSKTAQQLGISRTTVYKRLDEYKD